MLAGLVEEFRSIKERYLSLGRDKRLKTQCYKQGFFQNGTSVRCNGIGNKTLQFKNWNNEGSKLKKHHS